MPGKSKQANQLLVTPGDITHQCSAEEVTQIVSRWLAVFGQNTVKVRPEQFLWHIFSSGSYPSEENQAARASYEKQVANEYVVLSNDRRTAFTTNQRPESCAWRDYYVFPPNLAWTMAFTHEEGWLGPYFARHHQFEALNRENAARVRKSQEAAVARLKGWG
ncbi:MAG UNVERIFIED_CONTAM: DUF4275 family protein [Planctomycetaceae bacterium]|jgi:hypothetical protein